MSLPRALELRCGSCGASNEIDLPSVQAAAREDAAKLTDHDVAERYRAAFNVMVERVLPPALRRLPLARIQSATDEEVLGAGAEVLTVMLQPGVGS